ncbi:thiamine phosphate synthase [soil metagenome]
MIEQDLPRLHLIANDSVLRGDRFEEVAGELLRQGGSRVALHLRGDDVEARRLFQLAARLTTVCSASGAMLCINDRADVALAAGARGVQLGTRSMPVAVVRKLGPDLVIGASVHSVHEAVSAEGADFLVAGTLWPTESHPGRPGTGTEWLGALLDSGVPLIGIGGVTPERAHELRSKGVYGAAVVRGIWSAHDPVRSLQEFLTALYSNEGK